MWACGGMVDTLVLGTSAKAWEFESLHAQLLKKEPNGSFFIAQKKTRTPQGGALSVVRADLRTDETKLVRIANRFC